MNTELGLQHNVNDDSKNIIKVIGIGGGGVNAVQFMYEKGGIRGVNFAACNTDIQSFKNKTIPVMIQLGDGLGAGGSAKRAKEKFKQSEEAVENLLNDGTQMVFIAANTGGGTGTGAGPELAKMAKRKGILTVGVVTLPFSFEMAPRIISALDAVEEMSDNVDALIVVNNDTLGNYRDLKLSEAFFKPNEILTMAVKSIAEIITVEGVQNRDFEDITSIMKDGGVAFVSYGFGQGDNRLHNAVQSAINSPMLNNNNLKDAKRLLFYLSLKKDSDFTAGELTDYMTKFMGSFRTHIRMNWGWGYDDTLTDKQDLKFTIIATGFKIDAVPELKKDLDKRKDKPLNNEQETITDPVRREKQDIIRIQKAYPNFGNIATIGVWTEDDIVILNFDELNDDKLIDYLESTPPFKRSLSETQSYRAIHIQPQPTITSVSTEPDTEPVAVAEEEEDNDIINF